MEGKDFMDFNQLALARESCRKYSDKEVSHDDIVDIVTAAAQSPSACNSQPWKFVVCEGEIAQKMPDCIIDENSPINRWVGQSKAYIVVCETPALLMNGEISQKYAQMDVGIACASLCFAARDKGIGTCILGLFNEDKLKELLNIPSDINIRLIVTLGYPEYATPRPKKRKEIDEVVGYNNW